MARHRNLYQDGNQGYMPMYRIATAIMLLPGVLAAQAILQHSIAAGAGATAGTMMGKQVSNVLHSVNKAAGEAATQGDEPTDRKKKEEWKRVAPGASGLRTPGSPAASVPMTPPSGLWGGPWKPAMPVPPATQQMAALRPSPSAGGSLFHPNVAARQSSNAAWYAPPALPDTNRDDLSAIEPGTSREAVLDKLGTPSARVTIPENGRFLEVYYYQAKGETVGAVRLTDGEVALVQLAR
jgi:hypothetical protein